MKKIALHWWILLALLLALAAGILCQQAVPGGWLESYSPTGFLKFCELLGSLFLNALKLVVVPLIVSSIIQGLLGMGEGATMKRMAGRALLYYVATCFFAVLAGLLVINVIEPGIIDGTPAADRLGLKNGNSESLAAIGHKDMGDVLNVLLRMVPPNVINAAAQGDILGLILFSMLFGFLAARLPEPLLAGQQQFWRGLHAVMLQMTGIVIRFAPFGVFGLVTKTVAATGVEAIRPLALFFVAVLSGLALHMFVTMPATLYFVARINPVKHFKAMSPALLTAFSSSSSAATLPVTMDCLTHRAHVPPKVTNFVLPLGASINLDGRALYECAVAMFLAQAYGLDLSFFHQLLIVWLALVTSMGVAGLPSASLVAIAIILTAVGLPLEGLGVILAVDRILDMCRTAVNVWGDSCGAVVVAKLEGEKIFQD